MLKFFYVFFILFAKSGGNEDNVRDQKAETSVRHNVYADHKSLKKEEQEKEINRSDYDLCEQFGNNLNNYKTCLKAASWLDYFKILFNIKDSRLGKIDLTRGSFNNHALSHDSYIRAFFYLHQCKIIKEELAKSKLYYLNGDFFYLPNPRFLWIKCWIMKLDKKNVHGHRNSSIRSFSALLNDDQQIVLGAQRVGRDGENSETEQIERRKDFERKQLKKKKKIFVTNVSEKKIDLCKFIELPLSSDVSVVELLCLLVKDIKKYEIVFVKSDNRTELTKSQQLERIKLFLSLNKYREFFIRYNIKFEIIDDKEYVKLTLLNDAYKINKTSYYYDDQSMFLVLFNVLIKLHNAVLEKFETITVEQWENSSVEEREEMMQELINVIKKCTDLSDCEKDLAYVESNKFLSLINAYCPPEFVFSVKKSEEDEQNSCFVIVISGSLDTVSKTMTLNEILELRRSKSFLDKSNLRSYVCYLKNLETRYATFPISFQFLFKPTDVYVQRLIPSAEGEVRKQSMQAEYTLHYRCVFRIAENFISKNPKIEEIYDASESLCQQVFNVRLNLLKKLYIQMQRIHISKKVANGIVLSALQRYQFERKTFDGLNVQFILTVRQQQFFNFSAIMA